MAISFINAGGGNPASATLGVTPNAGDYIIVFAYKTSTTAPSLPGTYTNITNGSGNANSYRVGYRISDGTETTTGTWTNSACVVYAIYRGVTGIGTSSGATKAASTTANIPTIALQATNTRSWVVACAGSKQVVAQGTPLAGATSSRATRAGTTANCGIFDTNGQVSSFAATTSSNSTSVTSAGISVELKDNDAASALTDNFDDNSIDATKWANWAGGNLVETNQRIQTTGTTVSGEYFGMDSVNWYNLVGSSAFVQLIDAGTAQSGRIVTPIQLLVDDNNTIYWAFENGNLQCWSAVAGVYTQIGSNLAHTASTAIYLRIREASGTTYWDYSSDGSSWTNHTSLANPFVMTNLLFTVCMVGNYTVVGSASFGYFDNFNAVPTPPAGSTSDMFQVF